ncbi:DUF4190 domain-containing protein [Jatrophihabitans telluris]|uniref:DUF4190 domain-containing protein n=1 Tax=Jatrophihabitans telluris TaxID=2038343 RepID=A0ABY4R3T2_9ACTN|nr:DUF4190 domain-containing protein [Jatrophihabitans telluris]
MASFVCSLFGFLCCIGAIAGTILGFMGLSRAKELNGAGRGLAIAGLVISSVWFLLVIAWAVIAFSLGVYSY